MFDKEMGNTFLPMKPEVDKSILLLYLPYKYMIMKALIVKTEKMQMREDRRLK